jgi:uncharacterized protein YjiS (DUF1127 family)
MAPNGTPLEIDMQSINFSDASGTHSPQSEARALPRATSALVRMLKRFREHRALKRAEARLMSMSDRQLKDIGLTRVQIFSAVREPDRHGRE